MMQTRRRRRGEKGGVAALVAVLFGIGSLLGFGALAIDVGNVMWERRQLQNGATPPARALPSSVRKTVSIVRPGYHALHWPP